MAKIVALDVLIGILKQVYAKTKEYTDGKISTSLDSLRSLIRTNSDNIKINKENIEALQTTTSTQQKSIDGLSSSVATLQSKLGTAEGNIATLQTTTSTQQESINGLSSSVATLQSKLGTAESNITTLQGELATVKSDVADLKGKVYDYLGNDEIDKVFEEAEKGI